MLSGDNTFSAEKETLYVFLPSTSRPKVIQERLSKACKNIEIISFGKIEDLKARIVSAPPTAVLSLPKVLALFDEYSVVFSGTINGSREQKYVLLSVDKKAKLDGLATARVGVVDFLGRREMEKFLGLQLPALPKFKRVTKVEDLLPLLNFKMVDAILLPDSHVSFLQGKSKLNLVATQIKDSKLAVTALAVRTPQKSNNLIQTIRSLNDEIKRLLEVEGWSE